MTDPVYYLGIDAGGSRCKARLLNRQRKILAEVESGPANARIGIVRLRAAITEIAKQSLIQANIPLSELPNIVLGMGIAGIMRSGMKSEIENMALPFTCRAFDSDAAIACLGAHQGSDGAILILGTGSIAYIQNNGCPTTIGGYGFPISDEGSGAALGLSGIRHALRALDGRTEKSSLSDAILKRFDNDRAKVIAWTDQAIPYDYGTFAPLVLDYADRDDVIARSIVEGAAGHVECFIEKIFATGARRCALVGGVAPRIMPWLRQRTIDRLVEPVGDGLDGALILAGAQSSPYSA